MAKLQGWFMRWVFTDHAYEQVAERFPGLRIHDELDDLILLSGQIGDSKAYLTKSDAVIIVERDKVVVTVLTKNLYMANVASRTTMDCSALLPRKSVKLKPAPLTYEEKRRINALNAERKKAELNQSISQQQLEREQKERRDSIERKTKLREELRPLAEKDFQDDVLNHKLPSETKKDRHAKLKLAGHANKARDIYESIYIELYLGAKLGQR